MGPSFGPNDLDSTLQKNGYLVKQSHKICKACNEKLVIMLNEVIKIKKNTCLNKLARQMHKCLSSSLQNATGYFYFWPWITNSQTRAAV